MEGFLVLQRCKIKGKIPLIPKKAHEKSIKEAFHNISLNPTEPFLEKLTTNILKPPECVEMDLSKFEKELEEADLEIARIASSKADELAAELIAEEESKKRTTQKKSKKKEITAPLLHEKKPLTVKEEKAITSSHFQEPTRTFFQEKVRKTKAKYQVAPRVLRWLKTPNQIRSFPGYEQMSEEELLRMQHVHALQGIEKLLSLDDAARWFFPVERGFACFALLKIDTQEWEKGVVKIGVSKEESAQKIYHLMFHARDKETQTFASVFFKEIKKRPEEDFSEEREWKLPGNRKYTMSEEAGVITLEYFGPRILKILPVGP